MPPNKTYNRYLQFTEPDNSELQSTPVREFRLNKVDVFILESDPYYTAVFKSKTGEFLLMERVISNPDTWRANLYCDDMFMDFVESKLDCQKYQK